MNVLGTCLEGKQQLAPYELGLYCRNANESIGLEAQAAFRALIHLADRPVDRWNTNTYNWVDPAPLIIPSTM
jgi:hypothetical protein